MQNELTKRIALLGSWLWCPRLAAGSFQPCQESPQAGNNSCYRCTVVAAADPGGLDLLLHAQALLDAARKGPAGGARIVVRVEGSLEGLAGHCGWGWGC